MYLWISLIYSRYHRQKRTFRNYGTSSLTGTIEGTRWEWGLGKGQWKRQAKKYAKNLGLKGRMRATYFVIGSHYSYNYEGTASAVDTFWESF